jgi:parallel beta-helix repeat protein
MEPDRVLASGIYYVDNQSLSASDSNPGTEALPYRTIMGAANSHSGPNTTILVKPGVYRETVTVPASGSASGPFVFQAYAPGVVVDGADDFAATSKWALASGTIYRASSVTWDAMQVFVDGFRLIPSTASVSALPPATFRWVSGAGLYVNLGGPNPGSQQTLVGHRPHGFRVSGYTHVTIQGFSVIRSEDRGIFFQSGALDGVVRGNTVSFGYRYGIAVNGCANLLVEGNTVGDNQDHGIILSASTTGCIVQDNESYRNADPAQRAANGIYSNHSFGNLYQRNRLHHNQDSGLHLSSSSNNNISIQNVSWSNGDHGFDHLDSQNTIDIGNVAYGNYKDGFSIEGASPGTQLYNCIAAENGLTTGEFNLWVDLQSSVGFQSDYNIFWNSTSQPAVKYVATPYSSVAVYSAVSGQDSHTLQADPRFMNPLLGDFHLKSDSPAIDNADSGVPNWPATDAHGHVRTDIASVVDAGAGPVTYADRGAFEFRTDDVAPIVTAPASVSGPAGTPITIHVSVVDPDGDLITSISAASPPGASFAVGLGYTSGTLTWTPAVMGTYTATFTATNTLSGSALTTIIVGAANQLPTAALTVTPATGNAPLSVVANASGSTDSDGTIDSYFFDFGDGTTWGPGPESSVAHTYAAGTWTVTVTVTDNNGASRSKSLAVIAAAVTSQTNLVLNPSFESNVTGWNSYSGGGLARATGGFDGNWALQITGTAPRASFGVNDSPNWVASVPAAGVRYRITAWVRSASASGTAKIQVREYSGSSREGGVYSAGVTLAPTWQALGVDYVTQVAGSTLDVQVIDFPLAPSEVFVLDNVAIRNITGFTVAPLDQGIPVEVANKPMLVATVWPSPVRSSSSLAFSTSRAGRMQVTLYDVRGRRVRDLHDEPNAPAGVHYLRLEPTSADGRRLASGIYFYRIQSAEGSSTGRFVVER